MNKRRLFFLTLIALVLGFVLIGAVIDYNPDAVQMLAILGCLAGAIAGSVAR